MVAPPSIHPNGSVYELIHSFDDTPLAELPQSFIELARKPNVEAVALFAPANDNDETTPYGEAWFKDCEELGRATDGGRNNLLNVVAAKAGSLIAGGQLNENDAVLAMIEASRTNGLVRDDGMSQVRATIRSGMKAGMRHPRMPAETEQTHAADAKPGKIMFQRLSDVHLEQIDWLWPGVLARGKLTIFAGEGSVGKSTVVTDIAARITTGSRWPASNDNAETGDVVIIQLEDDIADTVKARFVAAGGDPHRLITVPGAKDEETGTLRALNFQADMAALTQQLKELPDLKLVVIDPIMGYMGNLNSDKAAEVRKLTTPLQILAQETNAAVLIVAHTNKSQDQNAVNSVQGSAAFTQAVRTAFRFSKDETSANDRRVMSSMKNNISKGNVSWGYTIETRQAVEGEMVVDTSGVVWEADTHRATADDVLRKNRDSGKKLLEAEDFLIRELADGPKPSADVRKNADASGISRNTLYRAADALGIPKGAEGSLWCLPMAEAF